MNKYVLIFAFNEDNHVLMIRKSKRPEHHIGLLNGLGGKIEEGETAGVAAIREFSEETGISEEEIVLMGTFGCYHDVDEGQFRLLLQSQYGRGEGGCIRSCRLPDMEGGSEHTVARADGIRGNVQ